MYEINIKKLRINKIDFLKINGNIDLKSRKLKFDISFEDLLVKLNVPIKYLFINPDRIYEITKNTFVIDENGKTYSCINCIFSIFIQNNNIRFNSVSIDLIMENVLSELDDIKVNSIKFKTFYLNGLYYSRYIKSFEFLYNMKKNISISTYNANEDKKFYIDFVITSEVDSNYNKLSNILYTILEIFMLIIGDIPTIKNIVINDNINLYFDLVSKYKPKKMKSYGNKIVGTISQITINKNNLNKFLRFRKETKIIYDLFMNTLNSDEYIEIKNCNLVQIMEGMYKTLINSNVQLYSILNNCFNYSKASKKILSRRDKRKISVNNKIDTPIFLYKAKNHRNYLSHLNVLEEKNVFYNLENPYAFWKLSLCIRLFILEYLRIDYNINNVIKCVIDINDWAVQRKIRFSSKKNKK